MKKILISITIVWIILSIVLVFHREPEIIKTQIEKVNREYIKGGFISGSSTYYDVKLVDGRTAEITPDTLRRGYVIEIKNVMYIKLLLGAMVLIIYSWITRWYE